MAMAVELRPQAFEELRHVCALPWPADPDAPEGHMCECGRRWMYLPAHWEAVLTLEELRLRQEAGDFSRGIIPHFRPEPNPASGAIIIPMPIAEAAEPEP
jgi:hypothetical protein